MNEATCPNGSRSPYRFVESRPYRFIPSPPRPLNVIVEVIGGRAVPTVVPDGVTVEIVDHAYSSASERYRTFTADDLRRGEQS